MLDLAAWNVNPIPGIKTSVNSAAGSQRLVRLVDSTIHFSRIGDQAKAAKMRENAGKYSIKRRDCSNITPKIAGKHETDQGSEIDPFSTEA